MTPFDIAMTAYMVSVFIAFGAIGGFSFASEDRASIYLLWFAPVWPLLILVAVPAVIAYRFTKSEPN